MISENINRGFEAVQISYFYTKLFLDEEEEENKQTVLSHDTYHLFAEDMIHWR